MTSPLSQAENEHIKTISNSLMTTVTASIKSHSEGRALRDDEILSVQQETDSLRREYENIFDEQYNYYFNDKCWWKKLFIETAKEITGNISSSMPLCDPPVTDESFSIAYTSNVYEYNAIDTNVIVIGRYSKDCDIQLNSNGTSRLHALLFPMPTIGKYIIVDVGSLTGIKTIKRSTGNQCESSIPNLRKLLLFDWNETAILAMGTAQLCINPKMCIICFEGPRECTFNCGHNVVCKDCQPKLEIVLPVEH